MQVVLNKAFEHFSETTTFCVKSNWNPPIGQPTIETLLSKFEKEVFSVLPGTPLNYNLSKEEWLAIRGLTEDQNIIIKQADKGYCAVVWIRRIILQKQIDNFRIMRCIKLVVLRMGI